MEKRPKTGGRKKGTPNKRPAIQPVLEQVSKALKSDGKDGLTQVVEAMFRRAIGVTVQGNGPGNPIYEAPPSEAAGRLLLEYQFGKVREQISLDGGEDENGNKLAAPVFVVPAFRKVGAE